MSKPKLDVARMQSELSQSAFFRPSQQPTSQHVNIATSRQDDKSTNKHADKSVSQDVNKSTSLHTDKSLKQHADKSTNQQVSKLTAHDLDRFTTYLRPATIKAVKLLAVESDRDVYEVVQDALDSHLREQGRG